jgi:hypothetical protein
MKTVKAMPKIIGNFFPPFSDSENPQTKESILTVRAVISRK